MASLNLSQLYANLNEGLESKYIKKLRKLNEGFDQAAEEFSDSDAYSQNIASEFDPHQGLRNAMKKLGFESEEDYKTKPMRRWTYDPLKDNPEISDATRFKFVQNFETYQDDDVISIFWFCDCKNLTKLELPPNLPDIGPWFASRTKIQEILIPSKVRTIGEKQVDPSTGEIDISGGAFEHCEELRNVTFAPHSNVKGIFGSFCNCSSLENIIIPASVEEIIDSFNNTPLKSLQFEPKSKLKLIKAKYQNFLCGYQGTSIEFPDSLEVMDFEMKDIPNLQRIKLPKKLKLINGNIFTSNLRLKTSKNFDIEYFGETFSFEAIVNSMEWGTQKEIIQKNQETLFLLEDFFFKHKVEITNYVDLDNWYIHSDKTNYKKPLMDRRPIFQIPYLK